MPAGSDRPVVANTLGGHRARLNLLQRQVVDRLAELADADEQGAVGLDAGAVSRHERGVLYPTPRHRALYCQLYGVPESELWPSAGDPAPDAVFSAPWNHRGTVDASAALTGKGGAVHRRNFLLASGLTVTAVAHRWLVEEPGRLAAAAGGDRITPELAGRLPAMIGELRRMDDAHDPAVVRTLVSHELSWLTGMLDNGSYTESTGRLLHLALAEITQVAGYLAYDLGDQVGAQRAYITALRAAHTAGDQPLGAHILKCMAEQAAENGRPGEALTLIDSALAGTRGTPAGGQPALLWSWRARALAALGDQRGCRTAIDTARDAVDRRTASADPSWLYWLTPADITTKGGEAFLDAGLAPQAEELLQEGLDNLPPDRHFGDQQVFLARLATAQTANGRLDAALASGHRALDLAGRRPSQRAAGAIRALGDQLAPWAAARGVADFLDRARRPPPPDRLPR